MLNFLAEWDKKDFKNTWSGTTYNLYKELSRSETIRKVNANLNVPERLLVKGRALTSSGFYHRDFDVRLLAMRARRAKRVLSQHPAERVFQVGDIVDWPNSFLYQDLSIGALQWVKQSNPESFKYSGFQHYSDQQLNRRERFQHAVYQNSTILTMSHWLADFINHREGESAKFVGGGLSETILSATPNQSRIPHSILFIGRDFKRKDGQLVVNAFRHLRRLFPDARLSIASLTVQEPEPGISWLGDVSAAQVSQLMASHQVFVMPSRFEAYGLVFLEAMANGMAIVGRNSFEMPWFVEQGSGLLIDSGNEEQELQQLVTAIKAIWNEPQFLAAARDAMGGIREAHSWQAVGERVIAAMQE